MMPPTSIDGTDITGATIDGTDVQEITVDGDTVFSAESLPVAYSNLVAWYPFDSSFYGGSNGDDVTALFNSGQSGDSTAYDGTVNGPTYQSSAGASDINAGANSGAFEFEGSNDFIRLPSQIGTFLKNRDVTVTLWAKADFTNTSDVRLLLDAGSTERWTIGWSSDFRAPDDAYVFTGNADSGNFEAVSSVTNINNGTYLHHAATHSSTGDIEYYINGTLEASNTGISGYNGDNDVFIGGETLNSGTDTVWKGEIDDVRVYDTVLSGSQIDSIYQNTEP